MSEATEETIEKILDRYPLLYHQKLEYKFPVKGKCTESITYTGSPNIWSPKWDVVAKAMKIMENYQPTESSKKQTILMKKAMYGDYNCYCSLANLMIEGCKCGGK